MNPLYDFTKEEIGFIQMGLMGIAQSTREAVAEGNEPPDGFIEALHSVVEKINQVIALRIKNDEQFDSLTELLNDVENVGNMIANAHDIPETIEYN